MAPSLALHTVESAPFTVACARPWLVARFATPQRMVSWSLNRPGFVSTHAVAWREVRDTDLTPDVDPLAWFHGALARAGLAGAVGMMTARNVERFHHHCAEVEGVRADCLITLGLNNGESIGRRLGADKHPLNAGTINILCHVSQPLTDAGLLEAASLVAQARTVALLAVDFRRPGLDAPISGTGTDCIVMAAPAEGMPTPYAGMHTAVGEAAGAAVHAATLEAGRQWTAEWTGGLFTR